MQDDYELFHVLVVSSNNSSKGWIIGLECTWHMTPNKEVFEELCDQDGGQLLLGNNRTDKTAGVGYVRFKFHDESIRLLHDVRYVSKLKK